MNRIIATTLTFAACAGMARAQHRMVVADMDTRLPLPGAVVATDGGERAVADHTGLVQLLRPAHSATVSMKNYMQRRVGTAGLMRDTLLLIPQAIQLEGVVVTAPKMGLDMSGAMRQARENAKLDNMARQGFDLLGVLGLMFPSKKKARADKIKKILEKY